MVTFKRCGNCGGTMMEVKNYLHVCKCVRNKVPPPPKPHGSK
jgi:hypothetical protein